MSTQCRDALHARRAADGTFSTDQPFTLPGAQPDTRRAAPVHKPKWMRAHTLAGDSVGAEDGAAPGGGSAVAAFCCGTSCCGAGQLCCLVPGPAEPGYPICADPTAQGTCPMGCPTCICASPDTPIATPAGGRAIASLRVGDLVYSVNRGRVAVVPIRQVNRVYELRMSEDAAFRRAKAARIPRAFPALPCSTPDST